MCSQPRMLPARPVTRSWARVLERQRQLQEDAAREDALNKAHRALDLPSDCPCVETMTSGEYHDNNPCAAFQADTKLSRSIGGRYTMQCSACRDYTRHIASYDPPYRADIKAELEDLLRECRALRDEARRALASMTHHNTKRNVYNVQASDLEELIVKLLADHEFSTE